jgi:RimJ/RimL family protein N-acetyltransferase
VILTPRLLLRPMSGRDGALFARLYCDAQTMRHIGRPMSPASAATSLRATLAAARKPGGPRFFVIAERRSRRRIGLCSLRPIPPRDGRVELGLMLLPQASGQGYARAALAVLIDMAFKALPIDAVWVQYRHANAKASRLCDAVGLPTPCIDDPKARRGQCVRVLWRPKWREQSCQRSRGKMMQNQIGFLEQVGGNAAMRHASRENLLLMMDVESVIAPAGGSREKMHCLLLPAKTPKKAPAKKKPAKAPPAKKPAKAPAKKKAPAKRKR